MKQYRNSISNNDGQTAVASAEQYRTLAQQLSTCRSLRNRKQLIAQAEQLARADVAALTGDQATLKTAAAALGARAVGESRSERIDRLQQIGAQQNIQSILNDRPGAHKQLVALYGRWGEQVEIQRRIVDHLILRALALIAAICVLVILAFVRCPTFQYPKALKIIGSPERVRTRHARQFGRAMVPVRPTSSGVRRIL
jgi:hypothetical protein